jgi:acyl phosphate:glycerol-3-phosphate acyltransferase
LEYVAACLIGYLLGSVPAALLVARHHDVDLRATGDGNPGAWNALEQLGARRAWPAFAGDGLKGSLAAGAGLAIGGIWVGYAAAAAAMIGHALPLFARLRGGKSVMTFVGAGLVLAPLAGAIAVAACAAAALLTRSFAVGARVGVFGFPLAQLLTDPVHRVAATGALMTVIGILFTVRGRSAPATSGPGAAPTRSAAP